jgi:hypothetical protein
VDAESEIRLLRERIVALAAEVDRATPPPPLGSAALLCTTTTITAYPTAINAYYAVQQADPGGVEVEGGALSTSIVAGKFLAANAGSKVPPLGTKVIVSVIGSRNVFCFNG